MTTERKMYMAAADLGNLVREAGRETLDQLDSGMISTVVHTAMRDEKAVIRGQSAKQILNGAYIARAQRPTLSDDLPEALLGAGVKKDGTFPSNNRAYIRAERSAINTCDRARVDAAYLWVYGEVYAATDFGDWKESYPQGHPRRKSDPAVNEAEKAKAKARNQFLGFMRGHRTAVLGYLEAGGKLADLDPMAGATAIRNKTKELSGEVDPETGEPTAKSAFLKAQAAMERALKYVEDVEPASAAADLLNAHIGEARRVYKRIVATIPEEKSEAA